MDTQGQGETKRFGHRADKQANGAPKVAAKVVRCALRFTVLVQGHDTRHAATIFRGHGVIADEDCLPLNHHGLLLTQDQGPPTREQRGQAPRRGAKEMEERHIARGFEVPETTQGRDAVNLARPKKAENNDAKCEPGCTSGKDLAEYLSCLVDRGNHANLLVFFADELRRFV